MTFVVVVGAQWGDEGKGKVVDRLSSEADIVVRYGGGANAGHTLVVGGEKIILRLMPSGALHPKTRCALGAGVVIDPEVMVTEIETLAKRGVHSEGRLLIDERAHLVLPQHGVVDGLREQGPGAIGTTKRGIGPAYEDKAARRGLRMADLLDLDGLGPKLERNLAAWAPVIRALGGEVPDGRAIEARLRQLAPKLVPYVSDVSAHLAEARRRNQRVLFEGAQGTMLDLDHGTYPYVTSSSVAAGGACTGAGVPPTHLDRVMGITKAYATRVGNGPFPTELTDAAGDALRQAGNEFGSVTGRPRRCGWLDLPVLRRAIQISGITELALTKLDVLSGLSQVQLAVAYELGGKRHDLPPSRHLEDARPVYESFPGWSGDISGARKIEDLPEAVRSYVARIEELSGAKVTILGVGADREHTIERASPFRPRDQ